MRKLSIGLLAALALPATAIGARAADTAVACETLIAARRADAGGGAMPEGCKQVPRDGIGTVEQRALIGGVPYECLTIAGTAGCRWVVP